MIKLTKKYKAQILYLAFGVLTTIINIGIYYVCYQIACMGNIESTVLAWIVTVIVAYATNKVWVFGSKSFKIGVIVYELFMFFSCRIFTELIEILIMYLAINIMNWNGVIWKTITNIVVIIINYVFSKMLIFVKKGE